VIREKGIDDKVALAEAIRAISYDGVLGTTTFDENGQTRIEVSIEIKEVRDGAWTDHKK
jgi:branched-chain amino acid transport system substrate-binding protein